MSGSVIVSPITSDGRIPTQTLSSNESAQVSAYDIPKVTLESVQQAFKYTDVILQINFNETIVGSGSSSTSSPGVLTVNSGAAITSGVKYTAKSNIVQSVNEGLLFRNPILFADPGVVGNVREIGLYNEITQNGWLLRLNGISLEFVVINNGVETINVDSVNFDVPFSLDTNLHLYEIQTKSAASGDFDIFIDKSLRHSIKNLGSSASLFSSEVDLPVYIRNENTTNNTDVRLDIATTSILNEGEDVVVVSDGLNKISINSANRLDVQSGFSYLMAAEFDVPIDTLNSWNVTTVGAGSFSQPINTYTILLSNTTGATDSILVKSKLLNLKSGAGEYSTFEAGMSFGANNPANHIKEWGYLDAANLNGCFFRLEGGVFKFVTVKGGVESVTSIAQSKPNDDFHNFRIEHLGAGKITGSIVGEAEVVDFSPAAQSLVGASEKQPFLRAYNVGVTASTPDDMECHWIRLLDNSGAGIAIQGRDDNGVFRDVAVNSSRRLLVSQEAVVPGPGETGISDVQFDSVATITDNFVQVPLGKVVNINSLAAGSESGNGGSKVELYEAPNGDVTGIVFIAVLFVDASNGQVDLSYNTTAGDGTRAILLRRERFGGGSVEIFGTWTGTYET